MYMYIYICTIFVIKLTIDYTTTAGINYKELYDSQLDLMTLMNNTLYTIIFQINQ
jgi:hypothetical protein